MREILAADCTADGDTRELLLERQRARVKVVHERLQLVRLLLSLQLMRLFLLEPVFMCFALSESFSRQIES